ncbi:hypothetical protein [Nonomuraea turcica]|uniref:hypothetical protein n=1 Tax=Nonomuraea sp. G32 TaxID=3067274 RepID=UPI00273C000F|nr:hypothetical protein [Nonomuraea sp. G32]MDP4501056.1 hypothetical protein [Nonomuraea sp. G32]
MSNPPSVRLLEHDPEAGFLLAWRKGSDGSKEYLVEWVPIIEGFKGGLGEPQQTWFPASKVQPLPNADYSRVPRVEPEQP